MTRVFDKEFKVTSIGGRLQDDYETFRGYVLSFNANHFPLLDMMGFNEPEDTERVVGMILDKSNFETAAYRVFIDVMTERVKDGKVKLSKILPKLTLQKLKDTPEEQREKKTATAIHRSLSVITKKLHHQWVDEYHPNQLAFYIKAPFELFRESLTLSHSGLVIDVPKFVEIYQNYLEADESNTKKQHQAAADAINRFFNGLEINEKELRRYFKIEDGAVRVNLTSVNVEGYSRLGYRGKV